MMEAVRTSETSVYSNQTTRRYIPEGSNLYIRSRENLKSHIKRMCITFRPYRSLPRIRTTKEEKDNKNENQQGK
jgi:hypothetical protein